MDGAGSYSAARRAGLLPTELTGTWSWILLRSLTTAGDHPQPPPPLSEGLPLQRPFWLAGSWTPWRRGSRRSCLTHHRDTNQ